MMNPTLSPETRRRVDLLFTPDERDEAADLLLHQCGNTLPLPGDLDESGLERFQFAALKLSKGNIQKLRQAVDLAKSDWRDLLMAAGFGYDVQAHKDWLPERDAV